MKVAIEMRPCVKKRAGIGTYVYELSRRLQDYSDVELTGDMYNFLNRKNYEIMMDGLHFKQETCKWIDYGVYRRIWNHVPISYNMLFKRKVDISHFFNFIVPPKIEGKVINTIHDLTYKFYPETMDKNNLERIKRDIDYSVNRSERIVTVSYNSKKDIIEEFGIAEEKVEVIYPGVEISKFSCEYSSKMIKQVREKYSLPQQYILYMGTLEPRKNISVIVEAFSKLKREGDAQVKEIKLVLAGRKGWLFEEIFNKVNALGLEEEVIFTDYVAEEDKAVIYQLAKLFVFPSVFEGFGIPVLEAMAAAVPVITSNVSSLPEVAGDAAILTNPKDVLSIAEGMHNILTMDEYRLKMIESGKHQAEKFSWDEAANQLYSLYKSIL